MSENYEPPKSRWTKALTREKDCLIPKETAGIFVEWVSARELKSDENNHVSPVDAPPSHETRSKSSSRGHDTDKHEKNYRILSDSVWTYGLNEKVIVFRRSSGRYKTYLNRCKSAEERVGPLTSEEKFEKLRAKFEKIADDLKLPHSIIKAQSILMTAHRIRKSITAPAFRMARHNEAQEPVPVLIDKRDVSQLADRLARYLSYQLEEKKTKKSAKNKEVDPSSKNQQANFSEYESDVAKHIRVFFLRTFKENCRSEDGKSEVDYDISYRESCARRYANLAPGRAKETCAKHGFAHKRPSAHKFGILPIK